MSSHSIDSLLRAFLVLSSCAMLYVNAYSLEQGQIQLTWEKGVGELVRSRLAERLAQSPPSLQPMMISVSGIPGSGKSVSSLVLGQELSDLGCVVMPFDGYHYPRQHLLGLPNAKDALYRRGAPDTFDSAGLMRDLMRIRDGNEPLITVPGFDHATADPEPDEHVFVRSQHKVVICEGLYLLHDQDGWEKISSCFDFSIFVQVSSVYLGDTRLLGHLFPLLTNLPGRCRHLHGSTQNPQPVHPGVHSRGDCPTSR